ncbi:MAG TPA: hypothetical protein VHD38_02940, partial [Candidatus Paceibacterota bacterium]|nr:hypothetical protein [Candidatus Paceibacterota bacterium]
MKMFFAALSRVIEAILDVVVPPKERTLRTQALSLDRLPLSPCTHELLGTRIVTLMDYQKPEVQDIVQSL